MIIQSLLALLISLSTPFDPHLTATWDTTISATITWHQDAPGCLYRNGILIGCYAPPGAYRVQLGGPMTDGNFRPRAGDVYMLISAGEVFRTPLRGVVYVPVMRA